MTDISASERRLIAALDRLDRAIERGRLRFAEPAAPVPPVKDQDTAAHLEAAREDNRRLSDEVAALHHRQAATLAALQARLAEAHERLDGLGAQAARLAAANDGLAAANRALIEGAGNWRTDGDALTHAALEAEIESLRAARAAEIAQMGEVLDALDRMIGTPQADQAQRNTRRGHPKPRPDEPTLFTLSDESGQKTADETASVRELTVERDPPLPEAEIGTLHDTDYDDAALVDLDADHDEEGR